MNTKPKTIDKKNTIDKTGARAGEVLIGIDPQNHDFLIKISQDQEQDAKNIEGEFEIICTGSGEVKDEIELALKYFPDRIIPKTKALLDKINLNRREKTNGKISTCTFLLKKTKFKVRATKTESESNSEREKYQYVKSVEEEADEGNLAAKQHLIHERNRKIINEKKRQFINEHDHLFCEACKFDYEIKYKERGKGIIECHHIKPISEMKEGDKTNISDLKLVCSNCHRIIHSKKPWLTFEELLSILK